MKAGSIDRRLPARILRRQEKLARGQTVVEYLLVVALFALAIVVGPDSPLERFFDAAGDRYQRFTAVISSP